MDRVEEMLVFVRVAEAESFRRAADQLDLPAATVSRAVQQLEARVGARLLQRTTRSVRLTQDGAAFLERCQQILADVDEAESLFKRGGEQLVGTLSVDMPSRLARRVVAPALRSFFDRYPNMQVELGATDRSIDLVSEGVDCVVRVGALTSSSLVARPLGSFELLSCASPDYLKRQGTPAVPSDLPKHLAVNYASATTGKVAEWEWLEDGKTHSMRMCSLVTVNSAESYVACCLEGLGLIQVPAFDVQEHLAAGELVEVLPAFRPGSMPVCLLYPHRRHLSRRLLAFADWLEELFADMWPQQSPSKEASI